MFNITASCLCRLHLETHDNLSLQCRFHQPNCCVLGLLSTHPPLADGIPKIRKTKPLKSAHQFYQPPEKVSSSLNLPRGLKREIDFKYRNDTGIDEIKIGVLNRGAMMLTIIMFLFWCEGSWGNPDEAILV